MRYLQISFNRAVWFFRELARVRSLSDLIELIQRAIAFLAVAHYGCPNSKRTEKLQLKKLLFR